jgi:UPF0716 protein FxsA
MWIFAVFVAVPLIEIALFVKIGGWLTLWPTLGVVVFTAVLGTWIVRDQGMRALVELRRSIETMRDPTTPLAHGAMILLSGALLLTPGFFTDAVGFLLLVPSIRSAVIRFVAARVQMQRFEVKSAVNRERGDHDDTVIDGEFIELDNDKGPKTGPSGWTRH